MTKPAKPAVGGGPAARNNRSWWPYVLGAGVVVATIAFLIANHPGSTLPGTPAEGGGNKERGLAIGATAPVVPLKSTQGTTVSFDQMKGSKIVVYFYESSG